MIPLPSGLVAFDHFVKWCLCWLCRLVCRVFNVGNFLLARICTIISTSALALSGYYIHGSTGQKIVFGGYLTLMALALAFVGIREIKFIEFEQDRLIEESATLSYEYYRGRNFFSFMRPWLFISTWLFVLTTLTNQQTISSILIGSFIVFNLIAACLTAINEPKRPSRLKRIMKAIRNATSKLHNWQPTPCPIPLPTPFHPASN